MSTLVYIALPFKKTFYIERSSSPLSFNSSVASLLLSPTISNFFTLDNAALVEPKGNG
jgi:hypothetical protein